MIRERMRVLYHHDGAIDEYMALVLLATMDTVELAGTVIINADCVDGPAMDTNWKLQGFLGLEAMPVGLSNATGWNPFPWEYRSDCVRQGEVEILRPFPINPAWPPFPDGEAVTRQVLAEALAADRTVTVLVNSPLKALQIVLAREPELAKAIERIVCMGGAIDIPGNLDPTTLPVQVANPTAEWNIFWDPSSVDWMLRNTTCPITLFPLNVTNQVPVSTAFMTELLKRRAFDYARLALQSYTLVRSQPYYSMWDVTAACYLTHPELFQIEPMTLSVETTGFSQGTLVRDPAGRQVDVAMTFQSGGADALYKYVLDQFSRNRGHAGERA